MRITPVGNKILLEWISFAEDSKIELPANYQAPEDGSFRVVAVGEGRMLQDGKIVPITSVAVGDEVEVAGAVGLEPKRFPGHRYAVVAPDQIMVVVKREASDKVPTAELVQPFAKN